MADSTAFETRSAVVSLARNLLVSFLRNQVVSLARNQVVNFTGFSSHSLKLWLHMSKPHAAAMSRKKRYSACLSPASNRFPTAS